MSNRRYRIRKRIAQELGKSSFRELTKSDFEQLWLNRSVGCQAEEELHEIFKATARALRDHIMMATRKTHWNQVKLEEIKAFPRGGLSKCEQFALAKLAQRRRTNDKKMAYREKASSSNNLKHTPMYNVPVSRKADSGSLIRDAYLGTCATTTKRLYRRLEAQGLAGEVAAALLRVQKSSSRAKTYQGEFKVYAYNRKANFLDNLCELLRRTDLVWGWGIDTRVVNPDHVLYIDLPEGQVSFHALMRGIGPAYLGTWDRHHASQKRILQYAERILTEGTILKFFGTFCGWRC